MATTAREFGTLQPPRVGFGDHEAPVIADAGDDAWVVVVRSPKPLALGNRFDFGGLTWEIVRQRDLLRGYVAWPVLRCSAVC